MNFSEVKVGDVIELRAKVVEVGTYDGQGVTVKVGEKLLVLMLGGDLAPYNFSNWQPANRSDDGALLSEALEFVNADEVLRMEGYPALKRYFTTAPPPQEQK